MEPRDPLHWATLLLGTSAAFWALALLPGLGLLVPLTAFFAILGAVLLFVGADHFEAAGERLARIGAVVLGAGHLLWVVAFIISNPINIKGDPSESGVYEPPAWLGAVAETTGAWLPLVLLAGITLGMWSGWTVRERLPALIGGTIVFLVLALGWLGVGEGPGFRVAAHAGFLAGWAALAAATLMPLWLSRDPPWDDTGAHA